MNYESLWDCANSLRGAVSSIETFIERNEGDPAKVDVPGYEQTAWAAAAEEPLYNQEDRVERYRRIEIALQHARWTLNEIATLSHMRVTVDHAHLCHMAALRCREALTDLTKVGEL